MLLNGQDVKIKPVLALDFPELRELYSSFYTSSLSDEREEHKKALSTLLAFALKRSDPVLSADPSPLFDSDNPNALDIDEIDELIFAAGGNRGKVLRMMRDEMVNWMKVALRVSGPDSSSPSPPASEPPSGT